MRQLEQIESQIAEFNAVELAAFRKWFVEFDASAWDQQFGADANAGRLDHLADDALRDHAAGRSTQL